MRQKRILLSIIIMILLLSVFALGIIIISHASSNAKEYAQNYVSKKMSDGRFDYYGSWQELYENFYSTCKIGNILIGIIISLISGIGLFFNIKNLYKKIKK